MAMKLYPDKPLAQARRFCCDGKCQQERYCPQVDAIDARLLLSSGAVAGPTVRNPSIGRRVSRFIRGLLK